MTKKATTAVVIGGGVAGPVTAAALAKAGIEATVYEAYPGRPEGVGGTLALAANGKRALGVLGADEAIAEIGDPVSAQDLTVRNRRFSVPQLPDVGPMWTVHRADLHRVLHERAEAMGVRFAFGKRLESIREDGDGATAVFSDGSEAGADVVVGADGLYSTVRSLIDPANPGPRYTGMLSFEAVSDHEVPVGPEVMNFAFGRRGYYLYWRLAQGGTRWGVNLPHPDPMSIKEVRARANEAWLARLLELYGDDDPGAELLRRTPPERLLGHGSLWIMPSVPVWHRGRAVLVGDSVHAPSNSSGQGASLAVESGIELARCLRDLPVPEAFAAYVRLRRARVEGIAANAAKINRAKAPGPFAQAVMPLLMPLVLKTAMDPEKTLGPIQRHRLDWDARVAAGV
ncbi:FAD-dependent oxidoreductase [Glycomyces mayteni]|uniref:FAD-dependent oxidoreductase n=1 Tax=Glycomyces mayteni TaxID=543887 RepID=A0ABW2D5T4_9ACTN|nr:FAD-dependent monooxygenase [Glycomyces mayteni]